MIRFGVIGTNWITTEFLHSARRLPDFTLTAVYSRSPETAAEFAAPYGAVTLYTDLQDMAQSDTIDAVYIASPNSLHAAQAELFLRQGKHVLCEKPIAANSRQLAGMLSAARDNQVLLMEAMKTTLLPNFAAIREHLPKLGPLRRFISSKCQYSSRYDACKAGELPNAFNPVFAGGSLLDIGIYCLYPVIALWGMPERVTASGLVLPSGVDGQGSVLLQYPDKEAVVIHSKLSDSRVECEIQGELGTLLIDKISTPGQVRIVYRNGREEDISRIQDEPLMYYEVAEFLRLIKEGKQESSINTHTLSQQVMQILDECRQQLGVHYPGIDD